jgi:hypothetical protein
MIKEVKMFQDYDGKIEGFYGAPVGYVGPERPFGMADFQERVCPTELPYWTPVGWRLVALVPPIRGDSRDPYVLYDRWGSILHVFNQEYPPSYVEVMQVCSELLRRRI